MTHPPSLRRLVRRAHISLALGAVAVVGVILAVPAMMTLRVYAGHEVQLLGRAISHTVEAAAVFGDAEAAQEALESIARGEDVVEAAVLASDGHVLAHWRDEAGGWHAALGAAVVRMMGNRPASVAVMHDDAVVGRVVVAGGGQTLLRFLGLFLVGILICQVVIGAGVLVFSGRMVRRIARPLRRLADVTSTVQRDRAFGRRVPDSDIKELHELGLSFNGLLAELDEWQTLMQGEHERLSYEASHDSLTGLPNRALFEARLNRALTEARAGGGGVAVMLIDCDKFKVINDEFGHAAGDAVLIEIAARLKANLRETDLVARLGGDEFAVLIAPSPGPDVMRTLSGGIVRAMETPIVRQGRLNITASLSIGFATLPEDGTTAASLLQRADESMYATKRARAGRSVVRGE